MVAVILSGIFYRASGADLGGGGRHGERAGGIGGSGEVVKWLHFLPYRVILLNYHSLDVLNYDSVMA